jgi:hypothetical protein
MSKALLEQHIRDWVAKHEQNGIKQHSAQWLAAKVGTIGGSSLATIQGRNPHSTISKLISEKIGLTKFESGIAPQWGNLFEDTIKRYVENDKQCVVYGEDLYIEGPQYTAYSPDGLAAMITTTDYEFEETVQTPTGPQTTICARSVDKLQIVLCEFKCPYSRIPNGRPPEYYVPQVKMGLDIMNFPQIGLLVEGVFRRCTWEQLGDSPDYDKTLVKASSGNLPLAFGINGFYCDINNIEPSHQELYQRLCAEYDEFYVEKGDSSNGYQCSDLGESPPALFMLIMSCYDKKILKPWYGRICNVVTAVNEDMEKFTAFCAELNYVNFGILPWKLFRIDYNYIAKTENYLAPWMPKIIDVMRTVEECNRAETIEKKLIAYSEYTNRSMKCGFSDD